VGLAGPPTLLIALGLTIAGCSGSASSPATPFSAPLTATVTDAAGDALADSRVAQPPDLVQASADASGGNITFLIKFASGTLDRLSTRVSVLLDTDQNPAIGIAEPDGLGADYGIDLAAVTGQATITKADSVACQARLSCFTSIGSVPLTFVTDGLQVTVPLSMLGNDDGRMNFQVSAYVIVAALTPVVFDYMPENSAPPARVQ
jgi:hypothetical protein